MRQKKQKKNDRKDENMRLYRKCNDFLLLKKEEIKNAKDTDLFEIALDYELALLTKTLCYINILKDGQDSCPPIYYRMCLELNAIYQLHLLNRLEDTNYQLFKIQANSRDIGEKERRKLAKKLGIPLKVFSRIINSNRPFYLIGAVNDYEHFRNIVIESYTEWFEANILKEKIKNLYDFLGIEAHIGMDWMNYFALDEEFLAGITIFALNFERHYKKELKSIKQIKTKPLVLNESNDENVQLIYDKLAIFKANYQDFFDMCFESDKHFIDQFYDAISFPATMIKILIVSYTEGITYPLMPLLKVIYEKCGTIYESLQGKREERLRKIKRLEYSFFYTLNNAKLNETAVYDEKEIEKLEKEVLEYYEEDKKILNNMSRDEYLNYIKSSPVFAVFLKNKGFSEIAKEIIEIIDPEETEELFASYIHGVKNSHSAGFSIFKNDDEFRVDILFAIKFLILYTAKVLNILKIVTKDEHIKTNFVYDVFDLNVFNDSIDSLENETKMDIIDQLESDLRILQNTFINLYREDIERYITKTSKPTEEEISEVSLENDNFN